MVGAGGSPGWYRFDLHEPLLTVFGRDAVDRHFSPAEVRDILDLTENPAA